MSLESGLPVVRNTHRLPHYLGLGYFLLTACACLTPFDEFRNVAGSPLEFLIQPWPRYFSALDALLNILGFIPLGFLILSSRRAHQSGPKFVVTTTLACLLFSFSLEFCQNYLADRVASNLDLACNTLGGLLGAWAGARWHHIFLPGGWFYNWRARRLPEGRAGEIGLLLIIAWWITQIDPNAPLFSNGDLRPVFDLAAPIGFSVRRYIWFEAATVTCNLLAVGLFLRCGLKAASLWLCGVLIGGGILAKTLASLWFVVPADPWFWASPGALWGIGLGCLTLGCTWQFRPSARLALANLSLLLATVLVNLAPLNPFEEASSHLIRSGHFIGLRSLTLALALAWPFCALSWLALRTESRQ